MPREVRVRTCHIIIAHHVCGGPAKESITGVVRMQRKLSANRSSAFADLSANISNLDFQ
jgi:hypothetical protein